MAMTLNGGKTHHDTNIKMKNGFGNGLETNFHSTNSIESWIGVRFIHHDHKTIDFIDRQMFHQKKGTVFY